MEKIFSQGVFKEYANININEARTKIEKSYQFSASQTTVFISHKHDDLDDLKGLLGFLESNYNVKVYIDSKDSSLPSVTSGETAERIKNRIIKCDKFILLATNGAIESKWCNWELGYGDANKFDEKSIALFPMKPGGTADLDYKGSEYMSIYPYISYYDGSEHYTSGKSIKKGYYITSQREDKTYINPLEEWLIEK